MLMIYNWKDMSGTVTIEQNGREFVLNLYGEGKCNCFLATVYETEKEYHLQWFFMDEMHGKRMLGLTKNYSGQKENCLTEVRKLTIYKKQCDNWKKIITMFAQAFDRKGWDVEFGFYADGMFFHEGWDWADEFTEFDGWMAIPLPLNYKEDDK